MGNIQFSGLASGIDSASLIDSLIEARSKTNEMRKKQVESLGSENDQLEEFNTRLLALNDLIDKFRSSNSGGLSKAVSSSDSTKVSATANGTAAVGAIDVNVTSVAKSARASFSGTYASTSTAVGAGSITIDVGTGSNKKSISVTTTGTDTLQSLANSINANSDAAGNLLASVVNVGTEAAPSYRMLLQTLQTGTEKGTLAVSANTIGSLGAIDGASEVTASDAVFSISGIPGTITRSTNSVSDVLSGITLQLDGKTTSPVSLAVSSDAQATADALKEIVDTFNDLVSFANENNIVTQNKGSDNSNSFGPLAKTRIDDDFLSALRSNLSGASSESGTLAKSFADLGLSTNRDGTLAFDSDTFIETASKDPYGATELLNSFADATAGVSGTIYQYTRLDGFIDMAQNSNRSEIDSIQDAIDRLDASNAKYRESLTLKYARLESTTARLQSQQSALAGLSGGR